MGEKRKKLEAFLKFLNSGHRVQQRKKSLMKTLEKTAIFS